MPAETPETEDEAGENVFAALHFAPENKEDRGPIKSVEVNSSGTRRIEYYRPSEW